MLVTKQFITKGGNHLRNSRLALRGIPRNEPGGVPGGEGHDDGSTSRGSNGIRSGKAHVAIGTCAGRSESQQRACGVIAKRSRGENELARVAPAALERSGKRVQRV